MWWLGIPVAAWAAKKIYDAVTDESDSSNSSSHDYEAEARQRERRAQRKLAREQADMTLRGFLQGQGMVIDENFERHIVDGIKGGTSGLLHLTQECKRRFEESSENISLEKEIEAVEIDTVRLALAQTILAFAKIKYKTDQSGGDSQNGRVGHE